MSESDLARQLRDRIESSPEEQRQPLVDELLGVLRELNPRVRAHPVDGVCWVPVDMIEANDYNPNTVASKEMALLRTSILVDGYTQPVVACWDPEKNKYVVVDGFHRFFLALKSPEVSASSQGMVPIVPLDKTLSGRMAATIRHNRARGTHSVGGMSKLVLDLKSKGKSDAQICADLGMEPDELRRLLTVTGYALLYDGVEFSRSWRTERQIELARKYREEAPRRIAEMTQEDRQQQTDDSIERVRRRLVMCIKCRCRERAEGLSYCQVCLDKSEERREALKQRRLDWESQGLCSGCGKRPPRPGAKTCMACRQKRENQRKHRLQRMAGGVGGRAADIQAELSEADGDSREPETA